MNRKKCVHVFATRNVEEKEEFTADYMIKLDNSKEEEYKWQRANCIGHIRGGQACSDGALLVGAEIRCHKDELIHVRLAVIEMH